MDEDKIAERAGQIMTLGVDSELAWKFARDEARPEEVKQLIAQAWNKIKGSTEIGLAGLVQILTLLSSPVPLGAGAAGFGFLSYLWGREQQNKFLHELNQEMKRIDTKLDQSILNFDEFMELFTQAIEIASKSGFEKKRNYLVNLFVNSVRSSSIPFSGKQALFRLQSQISPEEIQVLKVIYDIGIKEQIPKGFMGVPVTEVAKKLGWKEEDARVTCEALAQLFLLREDIIVYDEKLFDEKFEIPDDSKQKHNYWYTSELAKRFIQWVTEEIPPATASARNTSDSMDSTEKTSWSQLTTEQFFSGYSEADAIYDQI